MVPLSFIRFLTSLLILLLFSLIINWLFYYYYHIRLHLYLRKNRPDLLKHISSRDLDGLDNIRRRFQRSKEWHFGDLGEEDETIKYYKTNLKASSKIGYIQLALILVVTILLFIARAR